MTTAAVSDHLPDPTKEVCHSLCCLQETAQDKRDTSYARPRDDKGTRSATCLVSTDVWGTVSKFLPSLSSSLYRCLRTENLLALPCYHRSHEGNGWLLISRAKLMGGIVYEIKYYAFLNLG